jgi:hypothetical protein
LNALSQINVDDASEIGHWFRVIPKDGSPPLEGLDAAEFVVRRIRSGNSELPEMIQAETVVERKL